MSESPYTYYDLVERIEDIFTQIDSDIVTELYSIDTEYNALRHEADQLQRDYPMIEKVLEDDGAINLTEGEHKVLSKYVDLIRQMEDIERRHIYFRGHTDCFAYLKKIGAV